MSADDLVSDLRESAAFLIGQGDDGTEGGAHYRLNDHNICGRCSGRWPCMEAQIGYEARAAADAIEARDAEIERLRHIMACADTPLMRDVMAERDALRHEVEALRSVVREVFFDGPDVHDTARAIPYPALSVEAADAVRRALTTEGDTP